MKWNMWSPGHMKWQKLSVQGTLNPSPRLSCEHHDKQKFNYGRRKAIKEHSHFLAFINQEHIYELYCSMLTGENRTTGKKKQVQNPIVLLYYHECKRPMGTFICHLQSGVPSPLRKPTNHSLCFGYWHSREELISSIGLLFIMTEVQ